MPSRSVWSLSPEEHLRQLRKVYGPLSPAFVAEELHCTLEQAGLHLYGAAAEQHCWVRLGDVARVSGMNRGRVHHWVRHYHVQCTSQSQQRRTAPTVLHLSDARTYLHCHSKPYPGMTYPSSEVTTQRVNHLYFVENWRS